MFKLLSGKQTMGNQLCGTCTAGQEKLETKNLFQMFFSFSSSFSICKYLIFWTVLLNTANKHAWLEVKLMILSKVKYELLSKNKQTIYH